MVASAPRPAATPIPSARVEARQGCWRYGFAARPPRLVRTRSADCILSAEIAASARPATAAGRPAPATRPAAQSSANAPLHLRLLDAFHRIQLAEARLLRVEACEVFHLRRTRGHVALGFSSFADLARELLQMSPRSAYQRGELHETLVAHPALEAAFLSGSITTCQVLTIRPGLTPETAPFWIGLAQRLTVEQLRRRVREMSTDSDRSFSGGMTDPDPPGDVIRFEAPPAVAVAWEDALEMARRVLGRQAPRYACVEAILSEAGVAPGEPGADPPMALQTRAASSTQATRPIPAACAAPAVNTGPAAPTARRHPRRRTRPAAAARARFTIALVTRELDRLDDLIEAAPCNGPHDRVARLALLRQLVRPLRVLTARLLRDLRDSGAMDRLGYGRLEDFVERHLHLSARTARALVAEALLFEDRPELEAAYATGRISASQAATIERNTSIARMDDQIRRAEEITCRQFTREMRLLERLGEFAPDIRARRPGPLPLPGLENDLVMEIRRLGWTDEQIVAGLNARGCAPVAAPASATHKAPASPADICAADPAENPLLLRRLEALVDMLALASDQTPAARQIRIRFWAPLDIVAYWRAGLRQVQGEAGPLPTWALVTILLARAVRVWEMTDPESRPAGHRILNRDEWLCQVPGCTARRHLEVHHVRYRSRGGSNDAGNRITLCHLHHHHGIHAGVVHLEGRAPDALWWKVGRLWTLRGEKKLSGKRE